jgi:uncharacterized protein (TIGR02996 family)
MSEQEALLRAVCADVKDDTVRLAYADWLDENDEPERASLIRLQIEHARGCGKCNMPDRTVQYLGPYDPQGCDFGVNGYIDPCPRCGDGGELDTEIENLLNWHGSHWLRQAGLAHPALTADGLRPTGEYQRGFVTTIDLNLYSFYGGTCNECRGGGERTVNMRTPPCKCLKCEGLGRFGGLAAKLFASNPIEHVVLNDRATYSSAGWAWYNDCRPKPNVNVPPAANIPKPIFDEIIYVGRLVCGSRWKAFHSEAESKEALSRACVNYGRKLVGLDPLYV